MAASLSVSEIYGSSVSNIDGNSVVNVPYTLYNMFQISNPKTWKNKKGVATC